MADVKTEYGAQSPKNDASNAPDDFDGLISSANRLIESVYRDLNSSASSVTGTSLRRRYTIANPSANQPISPNISPNSTNRHSPTSPKTPSPTSATRAPVITPSSHEIALNIERINRMCENVSQNLRNLEPIQIRRQTSYSSDSNLRSPRNMLDEAFRVQEEGDDYNPSPDSSGRRNRLSNAAGATAAFATPEAVIDLSNIQTPEILPFHRSSFNYQVQYGDDDDDDDVILVSSSLDNVVDLCTPGRNTVDYGYTNSHNNIVRRRGTPAPAYRSRSPLPIIRVNVSTATVGEAHSNTRTSASTSTTNVFEPQQTTRKSTNSIKKKSAVLQKPKTSDADVSNSSSNTSGGGHGTLVCPVCMDCMLNRKPTSTKCGHVFCGDCIREAIRLTHKCPMCNTRLNPKSMFRLYL